MSLELLLRLLDQPEGAQLEFKEWKIRSDLDELCRYCCALANEGGGHLVVGVSDRRPRKPVGTRVFPSLAATVALVRGQVSADVEATALLVDGRRVLLFAVPSRPRGEPVLFRGAGYHREGESLRIMPYRRLRAILDERRDAAAPGLDWEGLKSEILAHLRSHDGGATFAALRRVLPPLRREYAEGLLQELCDEGRARRTGDARGARWSA